MEGISGISGKTSPEAPGFEPLLMASFLSYRMRSKWGWWIGISALIIFLCFVIFNLIVIPLLDDNDVQGTIPQDKCHWTPKDPLFFNIHTKLGVNYDAGHWFHMAENIMTYHSVLRSKGQLANASNVIFNFDHADFPLQLNGMTRFITYLGIVSPIAHVESLRYSFDERLLSAKKIGDTFLLDNHRHRPLLEDQLLKLSPDIQNADRFVQVRSPSSPEVTAALAATGHNRAVCVKYGGTVGGKWPTIQRGHWFSNQGDVESFREKIRMACPLSASSKKTKKYKLVLYQRDLSRKLLYQDDALQMIHSILNPQLWEVQVLMHSSSRSPCALYEIIHDTDVLLTPHGFQSMLLILMAPKKLLFEVFPYRYFKPAYSPFGREFDVFHGGVMSEGTSWLSDYIFRYVTTPTCMQIKQCRVHSRDQDVILSRHGVNRLGRMVEYVFGRSVLSLPFSSSLPSNNSRASLL